jgi:hypothetical protein
LGCNSASHLNSQIIFKNPQLKSCGFFLFLRQIILIMRNFIQSTVFIVLSLFSFEGLAQDGAIRGTVFEEETGLTMPGVNVVIDGTMTGTVTDLDGKFNLAAPAGTHNIRFSFISFVPQVIEGVEVKKDEPTVLENIIMYTDAADLEEVVITATMARNNETALLTMKRKSANMIDGISSANFKKIGDSDAASSVKRVPGVSIEGGKYVFVRGLGDRYTKTLLNGFDVPGLDPDRNTIQMDLFPTSVLDNIIVNKTFIANLPADFTGGAIDISTKEFPEEKTAKISVSLGYNPNFHFNSNYLTYNGSSTDFLGFDDGMRGIPATQNIPQFAEVVGSPNSAQGQRYQGILRSFTPDLAAFQSNSFMDYSFGFNYGNQKPKENYTVGYNLIFSYKNETQFYEDAEYGRYGLLADPSVNEMELRELQTGSFGVNNVMLSGMAGFAIKTQKSKYKLNLLHIQNGESKAGIFDYLNADQGAIFFGFQHNLEYSQKSMTNLLIGGEHYFADSKWNLEWGISPTLSIMDDPDVRFTRYEIRNDDFVIGTEAGFPQRIWRDLNELNIANKVDVTKDLKIFGNKGKIAFGGSFTYKNRDYNIRSFNVNVRGLELTGDPDEIFQDENLWLIGDNPNIGTTIDAIFLPTNPNEFNAQVYSSAGYVSTEFSFLQNVRATVGVRAESYLQLYTGQDQLGTNVLDNDEVLNDFNLFPTLNLVWGVTEKQNLRFSYTQTIARPSLKELSYAEIYDPLTGRTFIGGLFRDANDAAGIEYWDGNLQSTDIQNLDLRYEVFPSLGQTVSIGAFYKFFENPIEIIQFTTQANAFQPRNVGDGEVLGAELEIRTGLDLISEKLRRFSLSMNVTVTESRIKLSETEYRSRLANRREGQEIDEYRAMAGQAPLIINTGISFNGTDKGFLENLQAGLFYNVQSSTLKYVGIVDRPDIYTVAFHSINFNATKQFGTDNRMSLGLKVDNILDDAREEVFQSYNAEDQIFTRLLPGRTVSLSYSYQF